jgi:hypothetical protein
MPRAKRTSPIFAKATKRMASLRSISPTLELSEGVNLADYELEVQKLQTTIATYNTLLSSVDEAAGQITAQELIVRQYSERILLGVAFRYGKDSLQYMQAGGKIRKPSKTRSTPQSNSQPTPETIPTTPMAAAMN